MMRIFLISVFVFGSVAVPVSGDSSSLKRARSTVSEWVEAEKAISREEVEWKEEKALLGDLISAAHSRISAFEKELEERKDVETQADEQYSELLDREEDLAEKKALIGAFLADIEKNLRQFEGR